MLVARLDLRDFRNIERAIVEPGPGITVVHGANGAGKTNVLEGLFFALTGRSPRTTRERDLIRFDQPVARAEATVEGDGERHVWTAAIERGSGKQLRVDGSAVERRSAQTERPLVNVFLPDRLDLVKGAPGLRRAHLDGFTAALWPARSGERSSYGAALGQRNALLGRIRAGAAPVDSLPAWDLELAGRALALMQSRRDALSALQDSFRDAAQDLGLPLPVAIRYLPRSRAKSTAELAAELAERRAQDLSRGFTGHGPHRDDLDFDAGGRSLRRFGSQGQQRTALLCLLLAERDALGRAGGRLPLLLLDDVMSELDRDHRDLLLQRLAGQGQSLVTTTDLAAFPEEMGYRSLEISAGVPTDPISR